MDRQALVSVLGGVLGGVAGAAFVLLVTQKEAALAREAVAELRSEMQTRLVEVARSVDAVERASDATRYGADAAMPRVRVLPPAPASAVDPSSPPPPVPSLPLHSAVFEAAVLDVIERSDATHRAERAAARDEARRRRDKYWAEELTMRLGLTPAQTQRLSEIRADLSRDLDRVPGESAESRTVGGARRTALNAARERAEEQLRSVLTRQQVAAYEALGDELELNRHRDTD